MALQKTFVLPGDILDPSLLPSHPKHPLRVGPGLRHVPPGDLVPTVAGQVVTEARKNMVWVEKNRGRYIPTPGDRVIGVVSRSVAEAYQVSLSDHCAPATLPHLAFESASKKTRPNLAGGALVYARVCALPGAAATAAANPLRHADPELECVSTATTGKADGLGPLVGGMVFAVSLGFARRLLLARQLEDGGVAVLQELEKAGLAFETVVGRNGRVWVDSEKVPTVVAVGRALVETDERMLSVAEQRQLVRQLVAGLS